MADIWTEKMNLRGNAFGSIAQALAQLAQQKQMQEQDTALQQQFPLFTTIPSQTNPNPDYIGSLPSEGQQPYLTTPSRQEFNIQNLMAQLAHAYNNPMAQKRLDLMAKGPQIAQQFAPRIEQRDPYKQTVSIDPVTGRERIISEGISKPQTDERAVVDANGKPVVYDVNGIKFTAKIKYDTRTGQPIPNTETFAKADDATYSPFGEINTQFNQESSLRKEFGSKPIVKDYSDIKSKYLVAKQAYNRAVTTGNASAADQALITMFNKITDPQSVVRESEYARTPQNIAVVNRAKGAFEKLSTGGSGITNADRKAILDMAELAYRSYEGLYNQEKKRYTDIAKRKKIDPRNIVDMEDNAPTQTQTQDDPMGIR